MVCVCMFECFQRCEERRCVRLYYQTKKIFRFSAFDLTCYLHKVLNFLNSSFSRRIKKYNKIAIVKEWTFFFCFWLFSPTNDVVCHCIPLHILYEEKKIILYTFRILLFTTEKRKEKTLSMFVHCKWNENNLFTRLIDFICNAEQICFKW